VVPNIGSSVCPFAFRQRSSLSYDFLRVPPTSLLAVINAFGCTSHAVPDIGSSVCPFAFRQLDHYPAPSFTPAFISPGPSSAGARMLRLPPLTMTFINTLPPTHELEFGLWVVTAWVSPSPPGRVPGRCWQDISGNAQ
jgi:hypothetical protein